MILSKVRRIISSLWSVKKQQIDWLELDYAIHDAHLADIKRLDDAVNEERLGILITERERLRSRKKRHSHLDHEIQVLKAHSITRMMRAGK